MIEEKYCDTSLVYLSPLNKNVAKDLIIKNHYTHKWSLCTVAYGVYYKEYIESTFFGGFNSKLIGVLVYGNAVGRNASTSISPLLLNNNVLELTRVWIADGYGKNIESYCIAESFRQINNDYPEIKCILSYSAADESFGRRADAQCATGLDHQGIPEQILP